MTTAVANPSFLQPAETWCNQPMTLLAENFNRLAEEASDNAATTAVEVLTCVGGGQDLWDRARKAVQEANFQEGRRYPDVDPCNQQAKANTLEAKARAYQPLAHRGATLARDYARLSAQAADNASMTAYAMHPGPSRNTAEAAAEAAQDRAAEALRHAIRAQGHADSLDQALNL